MTREALQIQHIRGDATKVGRAVHGDVDKAAPGVGDLHVAELRIHRQHAAAHGGRQIARGGGGIAHPAAEQQTVVTGEAVVIEDELGVAHAGAVAHQRLRSLRAERFGGDDVSAHGHDAPGQPRRHIAKLHIARKQHMARAHAALRGLYQGLAATGLRRRLDADDGRLLVQHHPGVESGAAQSQGVVERVQVAAEIVEHCGAIAFAGDEAAGLLRVEALQMGVSVFALHVLGPGVQRAGFLGRDRYAHRAGRPVAVDGVLGDAFAQQANGVERHFPDKVRALGAELALEWLHLAGIACQRLTAVTARSAPADVSPFEQHYLHAALAQFQRGRQTGQTPADDAHIRLHLTLQRRMARRGLRGVNVVRVLDQALRLLFQPHHARDPSGSGGDSFFRSEPRAQISPNAQRGDIGGEFGVVVGRRHLHAVHADKGQLHGAQLFQQRQHLRAAQAAGLGRAGAGGEGGVETIDVERDIHRGVARGQSGADVSGDGRELRRALQATQFARGDHPATDGIDVLARGALGGRADAHLHNTLWHHQPFLHRLVNPGAVP